MADLTVVQREQLAEALHDADCVKQCPTWPCDVAPTYRARAEALAPLVVGMMRQAWDEGHHTGGMWDHFQHTDPKFGPDANPYGAAADGDPDDELFCPKCFAGLESIEHREKCGDKP